MGSQKGNFMIKIGIALLFAIIGFVVRKFF